MSDRDIQKDRTAQRIENYAGVGNVSIRSLGKLVEHSAYTDALNQGMSPEDAKTYASRIRGKALASYGAIAFNAIGTGAKIYQDIKEGNVAGLGQDAYQASQLYVSAVAVDAYQNAIANGATAAEAEEIGKTAASKSLGGAGKYIPLIGVGLSIYNLVENPSTSSALTAGSAVLGAITGSSTIPVVGTVAGILAGVLGYFGQPDPTNYVANVNIKNIRQDKSNPDKYYFDIHIEQTPRNNATVTSGYYDAKTNELYWANPRYNSPYLETVYEPFDFNTNYRIEKHKQGDAYLNNGALKAEIANDILAPQGYIPTPSEETGWVKDGDFLYSPNNLIARASDGKIVGYKGEFNGQTVNKALYSSGDVGKHGYLRTVGQNPDLVKEGEFAYSDPILQEAPVSSKTINEALDASLGNDNMFHNTLASYTGEIKPGTKITTEDGEWLMMYNPDYKYQVNSWNGRRMVSAPITLWRKAPTNIPYYMSDNDNTTLTYNGVTYVNPDITDNKSYLIPSPLANKQVSMHVPQVNDRYKYEQLPESPRYVSSPIEFVNANYLIKYKDMLFLVDDKGKIYDRYGRSVNTHIENGKIITDSGEVLGEYDSSGGIKLVNGDTAEWVTISSNTSLDDTNSNSLDDTNSSSINSPETGTEETMTETPKDLSVVQEEKPKEEKVEFVPAASSSLFDTDTSITDTDIPTKPKETDTTIENDNSGALYTPPQQDGDLNVNVKEPASSSIFGDALDKYRNTIFGDPLRKRLVDTDISYYRL